MTEKLKTTNQKHETQAQELTPDELEHVSGAHSGGINLAMGDGSVRADFDSNGSIDGVDYIRPRKP